MGCFDTVQVPCPKCGKFEGAQSKSGACDLETYTIENAPPDVLIDVNRYAPFTCEDCGTVFTVELSVTARSVEMNEQPRQAVCQMDSIYVVGYTASVSLVTQDYDYATSFLKEMKEVYSALDWDIRTIQEAVSNAYICGCQDSSRTNTQQFLNKGENR